MGDSVRQRVCHTYAIWSCIFPYLRAHILTAAALIGVLMGKPGILDSIDKDHLENLYGALLNQDKKATDVAEEECVKQLSQIFSQLLDQAAGQSRTGKHWVQYIPRTGYQKFLLSCVREMIPHFHAAGHLPYAKSARLYLQQMEALEQTMPGHNFAEKGYFTIRHVDSFWGGNFSDQTTEQFLMRQYIGKVGHALSRCVPISDELEQFTGVHTDTSGQHKDIRQSTRSRDNKDRCIFLGWLQAHPPFAGYETDCLVSLLTGIVADSSVNCDKAVEIGLVAASKMNSRKFTDTKLHRNDKVRTIGGAKSKTVKIRGQSTEVNPTLLFNRITCVLNNSTEMESFFAYELAPQPPFLFKGGVMRKPTKTSLGLLLKSFTKQSNLLEKCLFVSDGGHLLQPVVWPQRSTYADVVLSYISYILKHYGAHSTVVFDGYGSATSTKVSDQKRRAQKCTSSDIIVDDNMPTTTEQAALLANRNNKMRLIQLYLTKCSWLVYVSSMQKKMPTP